MRSILWITIRTNKDSGKRLIGAYLHSTKLESRYPCNNIPITFGFGVPKSTPMAAASVKSKNARMTRIFLLLAHIAYSRTSSITAYRVGLQFGADGNDIGIQNTYHEWSPSAAPLPCFANGKMCYLWINTVSLGMNGYGEIPTSGIGNMDYPSASLFRECAITYACNGLRSFGSPIETISGTHMIRWSELHKYWRPQ
jgi:hypothetical protein